MEKNTNTNTNIEQIQKPTPLITDGINKDSLGLVKGVEYKFTDRQEINWRAMVDSKYLYVNKENFIRRKESIPETTEGVKDSDLIIMLAGLRELSFLRGFTSITYRPIIATNEYAATVCKIDWIGNFETNFQPITYEDMACASLLNVGEMVSSYLIEVSANRAFCRAVRNFLKIFIVSKEELPPAKSMKANNSNNAEPAKVLADLMKEKGKNFEETMSKLVAEGYAEFSSYKNWSEIPGDKAFQLVDRFKNLKGRG